MLYNGLGLFNPQDRTIPQPPVPRPESFSQIWFVSAAKPNQLVQSLKALITEHAHVNVTVHQHSGQRATWPLGNLRLGFGDWSQQVKWGVDAGEIPLAEIWSKWWAEQREQLGADALFTLLHTLAGHSSNCLLQNRQTLQDGILRLFTRRDSFLGRRLYDATRAYHAQDPREAVIRDILCWLVLTQPLPGEQIDRLLDAVEHSLYLWQQTETFTQANLPDALLWQGWLETAKMHQCHCYPQWHGEQHIRLWRLLRWYDEPSRQGITRNRPPLDVLLHAYAAGGANDADLFDHFIGEGLFADKEHNADGLEMLSQRRPQSRYTRFTSNPIVARALRQCHARIVAMAVERGSELGAAMGSIIYELGDVGGAAAFTHLCRGIRNLPVRLHRYHSDTGQEYILTHLIQHSFPNVDETPATLATQLWDLALPAEQWIAIALYAPQWATFVEAALEWPGFAATIWWLHAHTKGLDWRVNAATRAEWQNRISQYTALTNEQRQASAVDVAWFHQSYTTLGAERWHQIEQAWAHIATDNDRGRRDLFVDTMLGNAEETVLLTHITERRQQNSLCALGLVPLPEDNTRWQVLLRRYRLAEEFQRASRQFGSQRQRSETAAADSCKENLARTAGYTNALRLQWAVEQEAVTDLRSPLTVTVEQSQVTLSLDHSGKPQISVVHNGCDYQTIPKAVKQYAEVVTLINRQKAITKQIRTMQHDLESAMCYGERFGWAELLSLLTHPLLGPMLTRLLFVVEAGTAETHSGTVGYIDSEVRRLRDVQGNAVPLTPEAPLRIAHPHDFNQERELWQQSPQFQVGEQPFAQLDRELYLINEHEVAAVTHTDHFTGTHVQRRQALAILNERNWIYDREMGTHRTFAKEGITAWLETNGGWYDLTDADGVHLGTISFSHMNYERIPLADVPPRMFSEVVRDIQLVVHVAPYQPST
jgi:hypothetical protein